MASEELPGIFPSYLDPIAPQLSKSYEFVKELAKGKTGVAYEIRRRDTLKGYCLKTISESVKEDREKVRETLAKEIEILLPLRHQCLPTVYEHDKVGALPFYICSFHPGVTFQDFKKKDFRIRREESLFVILSLIDVFEYLHKQGRSHCDFHHRNALLSTTPFADGVMVIDFGSGHRASDSSSETTNRGDFNFKGVDDQATYREKVERAQAQPHFEAADFRAFGRMLALMTECFFSGASHDQRLAYSQFCSDLSTGIVSSWSAVRDRFASVVDTRRLFNHADRLFIMSDGRRASIPLPVCGNVHVGEATLAVINTRTFQRLRSIRQLSFCEWYYPGGTHNRFEHSLGVLQGAREAISWFVNDPGFRDRFTPRNIDGLLLAALTHDIGHYPFAHVLEHYVASRFPNNADAKSLVSHSQYTRELLRSDLDLTKAINEHWGEDLATEAIKILDGKVPLLAEILDGPIDVDKLDYVRRDAHHCGVPFGQGLDALGIIRCYRGARNYQQLGISPEGVRSVEGFMICQAQMLGSVYWQEHVRAVIAMFHAFLAHIVQKDFELLKDLVSKLKSSPSDHDAFQNVIEPKLSSVPAKLKETLSQLVRLHAKPNFSDIFRSIAQYTAMDKLPNWATGETTIYVSILRQPNTSASTVPIDWSVVRKLRVCYQEAFKEKGVAIDSRQLVVDVPWGKAGNYVLQVVGKEEIDITNVSHLKTTVFTEPTAFLAPIRVYISPEIFTRVEQMLPSIRASAEERFYTHRVQINPDEDA